MNKPITAAAFAAACIAIPAVAEETPRDGAWRGSIAFGANWSSGNTDSSSVNLGAEAVRARADDKLSLRATALHTESETDGTSETTAELAKLGARYDHDLSSDYFTFGGLDVEHDGLQDLDLRAGANAGLGWHVIADDRDALDLRAGLGYVHERFTTERRDSAELVLGQEWSRKLSEDTRFTQRLAAYPNLSDTGEYRGELEATLATSIADGWTANVGLTVRYLSNPLPGFDTTDTLLLVGVARKFGPD